MPPALTTLVSQAAQESGLSLLSNRNGTDFQGRPTTILELGRNDEPAGGRSFHLELSDSVNLDGAELLPGLTTYLRESAQRLRNPVPESAVTLGGMPIRFEQFQWPFHRSVSGADTYIVHGSVSLADGANPGLHAKVAASMTVTFAEIVPAPEQPYAESFIYNAIRKTLDQGQLEMLKSGNRQPVPVTTRYYSRWQNRFSFTDSTEETRRQFLACKVFWLSGILGQGKPIWIADPRDAQYLNTSPEELLRTATAEKAAGLLGLTEGNEFAAATPALMAREDEFRARLEQSLAFTKPAFNEEMRHGHTNM